MQSGEQVAQTDKRSEKLCVLCTQKRYEEAFVYTDTRDLSSSTTFKVHTRNLKKDPGSIFFMALKAHHNMLEQHLGKETKLYFVEVGENT